MFFLNFCFRITKLEQISLFYKKSTAQAEVEVEVEVVGSKEDSHLFILNCRQLILMNVKNFNTFNPA